MVPAGGLAPDNPGQPNVVFAEPILLGEISPICDQFGSGPRDDTGKLLGLLELFVLLGLKVFQSFPGRSAKIRCVLVEGFQMKFYLPA